MSTKSQFRNGAPRRRFLNFGGMLGAIASALLAPLKMDMSLAPAEVRPEKTREGAIEELERQLANSKTEARRSKLMARIEARRAA